MTSLRLTQADVELFSAASRERNPLHLSAVCTEDTLGEPVAFGILSVLTALGRLRERPDEVLASATLEFRHPLYGVVEYQL